MPRAIRSTRSGLGFGQKPPESRMLTPKKMYYYIVRWWING